MPLLSVIIPVYNEADTIKQILEKINAVNIDKEMVVVDDGSTDATGKILRNIRHPNLKIIHHSSNRGKGAAFLTGLANATGDYIIVQDADLEYEPNDYLKLFSAIKETNADLVSGARFTEGYYGLLIPRLGNRFVTIFLNLLFNVKMNDAFSCYKLFRREMVSNLNLRSQGFDIDVEILTKVIKKGLRILEIPISYLPRNYSEGKKIRIKDGVRSLISIVKYRFIKT